MIHPTAVIGPGAEVGADCEVGPYTVIDGTVRLGRGCKVGPHVHLTGHTIIGDGNVFHAGCVIGGAPQDLKYGNDPTRLVIGEGNEFREHVTVHRANTMKEATEVGAHCLFMAGAHVGHNSRVGNHVILANGALLGGHVEVGDRVFVSANCLVHQFVRLGTLAMMQGMAGVSKDLPPYTVARGVNGMSGLNTVGLRRAGIGSAGRLELRRVYHILFRSGKRLALALEEAMSLALGKEAKLMCAFVAGSSRGVCPDRGRAGATGARASAAETEQEQEEAEA